MAENRPMAERATNPLESVDEIKRMLLAGRRVTGGGDQPTIHLPYHVDTYCVDTKEVPCLVIAVPLDMSFSDLRVKPMRWDDRQGKWTNPTLGLTISATCAADMPPVFNFKTADGTVVEMTAKKGLTLNLGLIDTPTIDMTTMKARG